MDFYRGDNRPPTDKTIQLKGFNAKPPAITMSPDQARKWLSDEIAKKKNLLSLGFFLRVQTPGFLISTAMKREGATEQTDYIYHIKIDNLHCFKITKSGVGEKIKTANPLVISEQLFLIVNNMDYEKATIIALGHGKVDSKEATFLTAIPKKYIMGYRGKHEKKFHYMKNLKV